MAYIGLGSNLGDRRVALCAAIDLLRHHDSIEVGAVSSIIETQPEGVRDQPMFLNAVVQVRTAISARELLGICLDIERALGRRRADDLRFGPRIVDLDLLIFGDRVIDEPGLHVPHPRMHERRFVLCPLAEIAPNLLHPVLKRSMLQLVESTTGNNFSEAASFKQD